MEDRRLAAIMFTDIVGYTALMGSDEDIALDVLKKNQEIHNTYIKQFNGTLIKEMGDGMLVSFHLASQAVRCAIAIQKACKEVDIPLKIGIHEGEMVFAGADVLGDGVNIASRLQESAEEGSVNISSSVYKDIKNKSDIITQFVGKKVFKNIDEPVKVFKLLADRKERKAVVEEPGKISRKYLYYLMAAVVIILAILLTWKFLLQKSAIESDKSIAVLPFKSLSTDPDKQYQADGVMDVITSHLAKISELRVIARTSVEKYRAHSMDVRDIGNDLDVSYIVEGSFQLIENNARLVIQLINTRDGSHVWTNEYDRDWSDIFEVQSEVAQTIAKEIQVVINPEVREIIETDPTSNLTAYDYFLQGKEYQKRGEYERDLRIAFQGYKKAVEIDPGFVLAWLGLASTSRDIYWLYYDRSEEQLLRIKNYLDSALLLSPNLKEVQLEKGRYYYQCKLDYSRALQILEPLKSKYPNDEEIYFWIAAVHRRMGNFKKCLDYIDFAISLDRANWEYWYNAGITLAVLREYTSAEKYIKTAIELNPYYSGLQGWLLQLYINTGQLKRAREFLIDYPHFEPMRASIEILDGNYEEAIQIAESIPEEFVNNTETNLSTKHLQLGLIYYSMSNQEMAFKHFELEMDFLLSKIDKLPNDSRLYRSLGIAYAGLGMKKKAMEAGQKALNMLSFSNDAHGGFGPELDMVKILLMVGEYDRVIERLDDIISKNGFLTVTALKLDPFWTPVREMDGFKAILNNPEYQISLTDLNQ